MKYLRNICQSTNWATNLTILNSLYLTLCCITKNFRPLLLRHFPPFSQFFNSYPYFSLIFMKQKIIIKTKNRINICIYGLCPDCELQLHRDNFLMYLWPLEPFNELCKMVYYYLCVFQLLLFQLSVFLASPLLSSNFR